MPADSRDPSVLARPSVGLEVECAVAARAGGHTYDARAVFGRWQHYRGEHCVPGTDVHAGDLLIGSTCDTGFFRSTTVSTIWNTRSPRSAANSAIPMVPS
ncbi:hypothetical protein [Pigmentiphaga litoralis]|uniref:hypothetical protein n=1 Tax=Pigmentiphaga litoralis TaxID=516702 RepID=UPI003B439365